MPKALWTQALPAATKYKKSWEIVCKCTWLSPDHHLLKQPLLFSCNLYLLHTSHRKLCKKKRDCVTRWEAATSKSTSLTNFTDPIIDCKITLLSGLLCVLQCLLLIFQFFLLKMVAAPEKTKCSSKFYVCSPETSVTSILLLFEKEKHQINKVFNFRAAIKSAPTNKVTPELCQIPP